MIPPLRRLVAVLGLALCLNLALTTYGALLMLDVDNKTGGSSQFHIGDATPSFTVAYSFLNSSGSEANFGVLEWSASKTGTPGVALAWSISLSGGGVVASGSNPQTDFGSGFADVFLDFRPTPGVVPIDVTTTFLLTLSAPGHAAGSSFDFKYTDPGDVFSVPASGLFTHSTASGFSVSGTFTPVPEPVNVALALFGVAALGCTAGRRWHQSRFSARQD